MKQRRIIDKRKKKKFMVDDEYVNKMARLCGWQGTIVYNSLCRHVNKDQECFPSIKKMAEQHGVSRPTIIKGIDALEKRNVIDVCKKRTSGGKWLNNTYTLLDKSGWDYNQVNVDIPKNEETKLTRDTLPSQSSLSSQDNEIDTKETHGKGNTSIKETHILQNESVLPDNGQVGKNSKTNSPLKKDGEIEPKAGSKLNEAIRLFESLFPGDFVEGKSAYEKKPTRLAVAKLMERYTLDNLEELILAYDRHKEELYRPIAGTVYEFCTTKLAKIEDFVRKNGSEGSPKWLASIPDMTEEMWAKMSDKDKLIYDCGGYYYDDSPKPWG